MKVTPVIFSKANSNKTETKANKTKLSYVEDRELYPVKPQHFSDINFTSRANFSDLRTLDYIKANFTSTSHQIYKRAEQIALESNAKTLTTRHIYIALLEALKEFIQSIEDGEVSENGEGSNFSMVPYISTVLVPKHPLCDEHDVRLKMLDIIDEHIESFSQCLNEPDNQAKVRLYKPFPSKEMISDIKDIYYSASSSTSTSYYDSYFVGCCQTSSDKKLVKEINDFFDDLTLAAVVNHEVSKNKDHMPFYDDNADKLWKNISLGKDVFVMINTENKSSIKYLLNSFANILHKPNQSYKGIDPEKTKITVLNDKISPNAIIKIVDDIKKNPDNKDKMNVIVLDFVRLITNTPSQDVGSFQISQAQLNALINEQEKADDPKIKFVMITNPETYHVNLESPFMRPLMTKNAVQTLPVLNAADTRENLSSEKGLKFVENEVGAKVTTSAIDKAIQTTNQSDGTYPDKAIDVLRATHNYFVSNEEITGEDVETYLLETKSLSEVQKDSNDIDICFDTGKTLDDIVGSPMTKADAQNIVNRILNKSIKTQGFNAYLQNGSSYGGGRRHTAEAIAGEAGIPMITINAKDFALKDIDALSQNANYSELKIKKIVSAAKAQAEANKNKTAMIFIENFDNFAANPLYGVSSIYEQKAFSQLLDEMKKTREEGNVNLIVVGSVNMPQLIDPNVLKPYKFLNSIIVYPPQSKNQRMEVLNYYINKNNLEIEGENEDKKNETVSLAAETTEGFTVVDIMYLLEVAHSVAQEKGKDKIGKEEFIEAYLQVTTGRPNVSNTSEDEKKIVTSHEAGHALNIQIMGEVLKKQGMSWRLPESMNFMTLDPRGTYGGAVYTKESENHEYTFEKMFSELVFVYGGHSSEKNLYDIPGSWGISGDIGIATNTAELMVLDMGMGPNTGVARVNRPHEGGLNVSNNKLSNIETDIELFQKAAIEISDAINEAYRDFIIKFTEKHFKSVGTGNCIIPSKQFVEELNEWRQGLSEKERKALEKLEDKILNKMAKTKTGKSSRKI